MEYSTYLIALQVCKGLVKLGKKVTVNNLIKYSIFNVDGSLIGTDKKELKKVVSMFVALNSTTIHHLQRYKQDVAIDVFKMFGVNVEGYGLFYDTMWLDENGTFYKI